MLKKLLNKNYPELSEQILRIGLALTVLWFGISQLVSPNDWIGYLPEFVFSQAMLSTIVLVYLNGAFETLTALMLIFNQYSKVISALLALHMLLIIFHLGYNDLAIRDFGIFVGFVALTLVSSNTSIISKKENWVKLFNYK